MDIPFAFLSCFIFGCFSYACHIGLFLSGLEGDTFKFNFGPFSAGLIISGLALLGRFQCVSGMARHVHDALALAETWICSKR